MSNFSQNERYVLSLFSPNNEFVYGGVRYKVVESGKPTSSKGEPKTDIYVMSISLDNSKYLEFKISFKQDNADFLENKMTAERAEQIFGPNWQNIIESFTSSIDQKFATRNYIFKNKEGRTSAGSITLGWRFELVNKSGGGLSGLANLTPEQVLEVYAGRKLAASKKNAIVNGRIIEDSGVANCMINCDVSSLQSIQDAIDSIISIEDFAQNNPNVYFVCKALNYRSFDDKIEGNRPLSVFINWEVVDNKLVPNLVYSNPLLTKGNEVRDKLKESLNLLKISNTNDINEDNFASFQIVN
ncbi:MULTISPECIES: hypothetical protein [Lysinibacillus]|uniref:Uncharacterized protein n=3 Tax=Lysinibacillus TaxID=400634 RepID=W7RKB5_LYSSH|nr:MULTISPECIES: hypothetical protein [Lysinibacillus]MBE5084387.1 hypothetical protein [Bacillus thuringiensis]AMO32289.1 hypothetical protein AR327_07315 [Lysinibacillus sphaericus]AMR92612.1 hypothetical protein A1T07_21895 [Lysinibacillus sphaericus]ANA46661.1 hypothetical protein A2J09_14565 [Lysinibacillus sphaericus]EWH30549.1 hypothetical protein P799_24445 [Lysinibacillus sphaericus CBAM5]